MEEILLKLAEHGAIITVLVFIYLDKRKENKELKEENKELNLAIRDQQKENIEVMNAVNSALKELISLIKYGKS